MNTSNARLLMLKRRDREREVYQKKFCHPINDAVLAADDSGMREQADKQ